MRIDIWCYDTLLHAIKSFLLFDTITLVLNTGVRASTPDSMDDPVDPAPDSMDDPVDPAVDHCSSQLDLLQSNFEPYIRARRKTEVNSSCSTWILPPISVSCKNIRPSNKGDCWHHQRRLRPLCSSWWRPKSWSGVEWIQIRIQTQSWCYFQDPGHSMRFIHFLPNMIFRRQHRMSYRRCWAMYVPI